MEVVTAEVEMSDLEAAVVALMQIVADLDTVEMALLEEGLAWVEIILEVVVMLDLEAAL